MNQRKLVFAQVMQHLPLTTFRRYVARYNGCQKVKRFSRMDHSLCRAFAPLTYRKSLRNIEACLRAQSFKLYLLGLRSSTVNANATRDWRIYCDFARRLITIARKLYVHGPLAIDLKSAAYAPDSTTIDLCLSMFP